MYNSSGCPETHFVELAGLEVRDQRRVPLPPSRFLVFVFLYFSILVAVSLAYSNRSADIC